jgi:hypothetical protein
LSRERAVLAGALGMFILLYAPFAFLLPHYLVVAAPAMILIVLLGVHAIEQNWPRARNYLAVFFVLAIVALSVTALPEANRLVRDDTFRTPATAFDRRLAGMVQQPAIVLYHFGGSELAEDEPVYNDDVVWPDDATIIRAHDLSPAQNGRLFQYYAQWQPQRRVYRVERSRLMAPDYRPDYLGTVKELADAL